MGLVRAFGFTQTDFAEWDGKDELEDESIGFLNPSFHYSFTPVFQSPAFQFHIGWGDVIRDNKLDGYSGLIQPKVVEDCASWR